MDKPFISIIITVLNGAKTLSSCLSSVQNQLFTDYELVIVDGGSTDNTLQIINESAIEHKIIRSMPGLGLYAGLNEGLSLATGEWLYFMGADDQLYSPDTLQLVSELIKSRQPGVKLLVGNVACVKQGDMLIPKFGSPFWMRHQVHHQGIFYERRLFDNLLYNESMRISSDYELNLRLAMNGTLHQAIDIIICNFGGDGVSENQLKEGYAEMQQSHRNIFNGISRYWVMSFFWLRRTTGAFLRHNNLFKFRNRLKKVFG